MSGLIIRDLAPAEIELSLKEFWELIVLNSSARKATDDPDQLLARELSLQITPQQHGVFNDYAWISPWWLADVGFGDDT